MNLKENLKARQSLIETNRNKDFKYFDIQDYLDLQNFSTYVFITPRNIGKSYSCYKLAKEVYETTGEWTAWIRTTKIELDECVKDFKTSKYDWWPEHFEVQGNMVIDKTNGNPVIKFFALTTAHNNASMTGENCFGIIYDEFLPRTTRANGASYKALTDFIKTCERGKLLTVILIANALTTHSDILSKLHLWVKEDEVDRVSERLRYRRIREWKTNDAGRVSTAYQFALRDEIMLDYMYSGEFITDDRNSIIPLLELDTPPNWITCYMLNQRWLTVGFTEYEGKKKLYICEGRKLPGYAYALTPEDTYIPQKDIIKINTPDIELSWIFNQLSLGQTLFSSLDVRTEFFDYVAKYVGRKF